MIKGRDAIVMNTDVFSDELLMYFFISSLKHSSDGVRLDVECCISYQVSHDEVRMDWLCYVLIHIRSVWDVRLVR